MQDQFRSCIFYCQFKDIWVMDYKFLISESSIEINDTKKSTFNTAKYSFIMTEEEWENSNFVLQISQII